MGARPAVDRARRWHALGQRFREGRPESDIRQCGSGRDGTVPGRHCQRESRTRLRDREQPGRTRNRGKRRPAIPGSPWGHLRAPRDPATFVSSAANRHGRAAILLRGRGIGAPLDHDPGYRSRLLDAVRIRAFGSRWGGDQCLPGAVTRRAALPRGWGCRGNGPGECRRVQVPTDSDYHGDVIRRAFCR